VAGQLYKHWKHVPDWLWDLCPNFHPAKGDKMLASPDTGSIYFDIESFQALQTLRENTGPQYIISGYRTELHNARVGGGAMSQHFLKIAFDIALRGQDSQVMAREAVRAGFTGIGYYPTRGFIHVDRGDSRVWYGSKKDKQIITQAVDIKV